MILYYLVTESKNKKVRSISAKKQKHRNTKDHNTHLFPFAFAKSTLEPTKTSECNSFRAGAEARPFHYFFCENHVVQITFAKRKLLHYSFIFRAILPKSYIFRGLQAPFWPSGAREWKRKNNKRIYSPKYHKNYKIMETWGINWNLVKIRTRLKTRL